MKKKIALALTTIMALSNGVSLFAADAPAGGSVSGDGEVEYIDTEIYSVVLPTTASLDFSVDPLGLLAVEDGATADLANLDKGKIVGNSTLSILNKSSVPVSVDIELDATGDADFQTDKSLVEEDDSSAWNAMFLALPAKQAMTAQGDDLGSDYVANDAGIIFDDNSTVSIKFTFPAAKYNVANTGGTYSYAIATDTNGVQSVGGGSGFKIAGYVNTQANWEDFAGGGATKTMAVNATYTIAKATDAEIEDAEDSSVYAISAITGAIGWEAYEAADANTAQFAVAETSTGITITPPAGVTLASTPFTANYNGTATNIAAWSIGPRLANNVFTVTTSCLNNLTAESNGSYKFTVTDTSGNTYDVTYTPAP